MSVPPPPQVDYLMFKSSYWIHCIKNWQTSSTGWGKNAIGQWKFPLQGHCRHAAFRYDYSTDTQLPHLQAQSPERLGLQPLSLYRSQSRWGNNCGSWAPHWSETNRCIVSQAALSASQAKGKSQNVTGLALTKQMSLGSSCIWEVVGGCSRMFRTAGSESADEQAGLYFNGLYPKLI